MTSPLARELLDRGLPPQSPANFYKRLAQIRQLVEYCVNKGWVDHAVPRRIVEGLALDSRHARKRDALQRGDIRAVVDDGYVAFTNDEPASLFGPVFDKHVRGLAYRYWTPLIAAYTGMRVSEVSQLSPHDFELVDGI